MHIRAAASFDCGCDVPLAVTRFQSMLQHRVAMLMSLWGHEFEDSVDQLGFDLGESEDAAVQGETAADGSAAGSLAIVRRH